MKRTIAALGAVLFCAATTAIAAEQATFITRDGQRHTGQVVFHGSHSYNLIDDNLNLNIGGTEQTFPEDQVAVIDFAGGTPQQNELQAIPASGHLLALRNGQLLTGHFENIVSGETVMWQSSTGGTQSFPISQVSRIYLSPDAGRVAYNYNGPTGMGAAPSAVGTSGQVATPGSVQVQANQPWTSTGVMVKKGDRVAFQTTGQILYAQGADATAGPDGNGQIQNPQFPVPAMPVGGLIGKVGNSQPFPIGSNSQPIVMPADGMLLLGINDNVVNDNSGAFSVVVSKR